MLDYALGKMSYALFISATISGVLSVHAFYNEFYAFSAVFVYVAVISFVTSYFSAQLSKTGVNNGD